MNNIVLWMLQQAHSQVSTGGNLWPLVTSTASLSPPLVPPLPPPSAAMGMVGNMSTLALCVIWVWIEQLEICCPPALRYCKQIEHTIVVLRCCTGLKRVNAYINLIITFLPQIWLACENVLFIQDMNIPLKYQD